MRAPFPRPSRPAGPRGRLTVGSLVALASIVASSGCAPGSPGDDRSDLRVLYTASVDGFLEPCGCVAGRFGGVDRLAAWIEREQRDHPATVFVDAGDLYSSYAVEDKFVLEQLHLKADALYRLWGELGCDAIGLGCLDLNLDLDVVRGAAERHGVPLLCANLYDEQGERVLPASRVFERGDLRIGVFAVLARELDHNVLDGTERVSAGDRAAEQGLRIGNFYEAAAEVAAELRDEVDMLICLAHVGTRRGRELANRVPEIDLLVGCHPEGKDARSVELTSAVPMVTLDVKGSRGGRFDLWLEDPDAYLGAGPQRQVSDDTGREQIPIELEVVSTTLSGLAGREPVLGSKEYERQRLVNLAAYEQGQALLEQLTPPPDGNRFANVLVPMYPGIGRSERALRVIDDYHDALAEFWLGYEDGRARGAELPNASYAGAEACMGCHTSQYEFWKATRHSRALHSLEITNQHLDVECARCHTIGYRTPDGWTNPARNAGFENVQCAACHGPDSAHAQGLLGHAFGESLRQGSERCESCHNKQHDPKFAQLKTKKLIQVTCPPMPPPGEGPPAFVAALENAAEALKRRPEPPWERIALSLHRAGDFEGSLEAGSRWLEEQGGLRPRLHRASALIALERYADALVELEHLVQRAKADRAAWALYTQALIVERPELAMPAALEAYSLAPDDPTSAVLVARAAMAAGDRLGALDSLRAHIERRPQDEPVLRPLIEEYSGIGGS